MSKTFPATAITIKSTKLGETDLILSLLDSEGTFLKGVLKSARNPRSKTVGHSALYQTNKLLLHKGKSLDVITEVQTLTSRGSLMISYLKGLSASFCSEIAYLSINLGNKEPQLFSMLEALLDALEKADEEKCLGLAVSFGLKTLALLGLRPQTDFCVLCEDDCDQFCWSNFHQAVVCASCVSAVEEAATLQNRGIPSKLYSLATVEWINFLLKNTFACVLEQNIPKEALGDVADITKNILEDFFNTTIKSFPQLKSAIISLT